MLTVLDKYRKRCASVILMSYIFLVSLTIFHYHHVDIENGDYQLLNGSETQLSTFDRLVDLTHECTIQQFASTVLDYSFTNIFNFVKNSDGHDFYTHEVLIPLTSTRYNSNPHRAPPSLLINQI